MTTDELTVGGIIWFVGWNAVIWLQLATSRIQSRRIDRLVRRVDELGEQLRNAR